jgi:endonuclease-3
MGVAARPSDKAETRRAKRPFDPRIALQRIREAVQPLPKAAMFQLFEEGFDSLFEQLVACIISIRTLEEVTLPTARQLFSRARSPAEMSQLTPEQIDDLIHTCTFHEPKARQIQEIAERTVAEYGGSLPCDFDVLTSFRGVGPKCGNLALGIACGHAAIGVDVHVHRITNRWGYVRAKTPEMTMAELEARLPVSYWLEINRLLVPFGKHICTGRLPHCSTCPVLDMCEQVGVTEHR